MPRRLVVLVGPLMLVALWAAVTYAGLVRPLFLPPPDDVVAALTSALSTADFWSACGLTVYRWLLGVAIGSAVGVSIGLLIGTSERIYTASEIPIDFFRSLPVMTLFPLFLLMFATGDTAKVAAAAWGSFLFVAVNTSYGVRYSRQSRMLVARVLRASPLQTIFKFVLPGALPSIFAGLRVSISLGLVIVIATEMIMGTKQGLGKRIFEDALIYQMEDMYAMIFVVGTFGYLANKLAVVTEDWLIHWKHDA